MKITFVRKTLPSLFTGWSEYQAGWQADLPHGADLVAEGSARAGWGKPVPEPVQEPEPEVVLPDYHALSVPALRKEAKAAGVWKRGMDKDEMLEALK